MARPVEVAYDTTPSIITDHPFRPKGAWWTMCEECNLAESSHSESTTIRYVGDGDNEDD